MPLTGNTRPYPASIDDAFDEVATPPRPLDQAPDAEGPFEDFDETHPLEHWWMDTARTEVSNLITKMEEYGGNGRALDLTAIGDAMRTAGVGRGTPHLSPITEAQTQELGIYFYLVGKFARWTAAIAEGRPVSDDTLHDIGIYVRMAQRIRQSGGWPV